jgi:NAD-dependent SIR2 family protein deacetylase
MSLKLLIPTVSKAINKKEDEVIKYLTKIAEIVKDEVFVKTRLYSYEFEEEEVDLIFRELIKADYASKYYRYECEKTGDLDYAVSLRDKCEFCGELLSRSKEHIIIESYKLNSIFLKFIEEEKVENLNRYLHAEYRHNLDTLKGQSNKVIPFLGAGVSIPFGLPNWGGLLKELDKGLNEVDQQKYQDLIDEGNYFRALSLLKTYSVAYNNEQSIKNDIKRILKNSQRKQDSNNHNLVDILKLDSQFIATTNYDNILSEYRMKYRDDFSIPLTLKTLEEVNDLLNNDVQQILHFHGNYDTPSSMIVTEEDYEELYNEGKIESVLNAIMANRSLLFIGFSFNDQYFKDLYNKIYETIGGEHFIIVPNLHQIDAKDLLKQNLIPINLKVDFEKENDYVNAIRTILEKLY